MQILPKFAEVPVIADVRFAEEVAETTPNDTHRYTAVSDSSDQTTLRIILRLRQQSEIIETTATQIWREIEFERQNACSFPSLAHRDYFSALSAWFPTGLVPIPFD
jgi:hypothetical protein